MYHKPNPSIHQIQKSNNSFEYMTQPNCIRNTLKKDEKIEEKQFTSSCQRKYMYAYGQTKSIISNLITYHFIYIFYSLHLMTYTDTGSYFIRGISIHIYFGFLIFIPIACLSRTNFFFSVNYMLRSHTNIITNFCDSDTIFFYHLRIKFIIIYV